VALGVATCVASAIAISVMIQIGGSFGKALTAIGRFDAGWLAVAAACAIVGPVLVGEALWRLQGRPAVLTRPTAQAAALVNFSLGQLMPAAPIEGWTLSFRELRRRGLPPRRAGLALAWGLWMQGRAIQLLGGMSALAVVAFGDLSGRLATTAVLGACAAFVSVVVGGLVVRRPRFVAAVGARLSRFLPVKASPDEVRQKVLQFHGEAHAMLGGSGYRKVSWLLVAFGQLAVGASLWATLEAGSYPVSFPSALLAGMLIPSIAWVPFLPGGIGVVESSLALFLHHFGVPLSEGVAAGVVWRGMTLVLPAAAGVLALGGLRLQRVPAPAG
jgi:uncharacterized membrane protein YbhN (UPF0104 family)